MTVLPFQLCRAFAISRCSPERNRQDDCVCLECNPQRLGDDRGSNRPSLRRQRLGEPAARDGHVDVFTGEGVGEGLAYLTESYNRIAHNVSPIRVDNDSQPSTAWNIKFRSVATFRNRPAVNYFAGGREVSR